MKPVGRNRMLRPWFLHERRTVGQGRGMSGQDIERLDPERRRRRIQLLAELAEARALRNRVAPRRARHERQRDLITNRRRMA